AFSEPGIYPMKQSNPRQRGERKRSPSEGRRARHPRADVPGASASWPPVIRLGGLAPAPPFPVDALPAVARNLTSEVADALGAPPDYAGHCCLVVAGAAAGAAVALQVKEGWLERACLFAALVGPSGAAKTPSLLHVARPVFQAQEGLSASHE